MWSDYRSKIRSVIKDDLAPDYLIDDESLLLYANHSLAWVATVHPKLAKESLSVDDDGQCSCSSDVHQIEAVVGEYVSYEQGGWQLNANEYYVIGNDITIEGTDTSVTVVYLTGYEPLADDEDEIPVKDRHKEPWMNYVISRCLAHLAVESGDISQWDTKTDSGNPEDNPLLQLSAHYEKMAIRGLGAA